MRAARPLIYFSLISFGILIGIFLRPGHSVNRTMLDEMWNLVDQKYVDTVNRNLLNHAAIEGLLSELDPHSVFIPAEELKTVNEPLEGNFVGIGIEFNIIEDTILVVTPIPGGPSEEAGVLTGDRIVSVNDSNVAGVGITNEKVIHLLKGPENTRVKVTFFRPSTGKLIPVSLARRTIPIYSVDASFMVDERVGYIRLVRFSEQTYDEFHNALKDLKNRGLQKLILDVRGNPGGYLDKVTKVVDELLPDDKLVVYTEGLHQPRRNYTCSNRGLFENGPLVVLIDEGSASASEILAGALQDWDRCTVIGRRSYGKGLVQETFPLSDGSAVRLTVARYYTPTGRCIQKPYGANHEDYQHEISERYQQGELTTGKTGGDTLHQFKTPGGKIVYGGGGITPDYFVPLDTEGVTPTYTKIRSEGLLNKWVYDYASVHAKEIKSFGTFQRFAATFQLPTSFNAALLALASKHVADFNVKEFNASLPLLRHQALAMLAKQGFGENGLMYVLLMDDKTFLKAIEELKKNK